MLHFICHHQHIPNPVRRNFRSDTRLLEDVELSVSPRRVGRRAKGKEALRIGPLAPKTAAHREADPPVSDGDSVSSVRHVGPLDRSQDNIRKFLVETPENGVQFLKIRGHSVMLREEERFAALQFRASEEAEDQCWHKECH